MNIFEWKETHSKQPVSLWDRSQQKTVDIVRKVYVTETGSAYIKHQGYVQPVRGSAEYGWHGTC